ncbi:hypothetical protein ACEN2J_14480 [Pseudorhodobacter sp. W20_MBD10_FR17]|uniref:hypothetical protein n=1 Tax=Pseudorhodobacter sp. W20_MBD10_FR17 TaxID=3240266 RepID=UPI003F9B1A52
MDARPNEIATSTAATLIGVSYEMIRRLVKAGNIPSHRRGLTTVDGAVQGYAEFLREDARRAEANASAVRAHNAKAATVAAANSRRRAGLVDAEEIEIVLTALAGIATARLAGLDLAGRVSPQTAKQVAAEVKATACDFASAHAHAVALLKGEKPDDE